MLRITNDLLLAVDDGQVGCLVLLDLSAAFDTIDHRILLQKLSSRLHLSKSAFHWFASYLEDRYRKVVIGDETSSNFKLQYARVCIWTLAFHTVYSWFRWNHQEIIKSHVSCVCRRHIIVYFFLAHRCGNIHAATGSLHSSKHSLRPLQIDGMNILPVENVKSLGVTLDCCLTLTNISVLFAVLLLCTSETLERSASFDSIYHWKVGTCLHHCSPGLL